ncbi:sensor histidine kinase [Massilia horti]|nr:histidine kinase [Massilia horti]
MQPVAPSFTFLVRRLVKDAPLGFVFSALCGVVIALVTGNMHRAYLNIVYSVCIGMLALLLIDTARLLIFHRPGNRKMKWVLLVAVLLVSAPIANFGGIVIAASLLGHPIPPLRSIFAPAEANMMLFTLLAATGAVMLFINRERMARIEAEVAKERARAEIVERQAVQAQLQLLQAQIEPHMLFNTLANLQGLIAIDPERASHILDQFIQYLRATLTSSRAPHTTLAQEFELIDAYLGLMCMRMGERLRYRLELPDALRRLPLPPMLLQPLVENAIIHGLEPTVAGGEITISARVSGDMLDLSVCDTGCGLSDAPRTAGTRVGVANTRDRLQGLFGERARLELETAIPRGTIARLTLPLEQS